MVKKMKFTLTQRPEVRIWTPLVTLLLDSGTLSPSSDDACSIEILFSLYQSHFPSCLSFLPFRLSLWATHAMGIVPQLHSFIRQWEIMEYCNDIDFHVSNKLVIQRPLGSLTAKVSGHDKCIASLNCKILLQKWLESLPELIPRGEQYNLTGSLWYLRSMTI